jgi:hypothetical protein
MTPEPMIVQHDDRAIYRRRRWERTERSEICIADSFEYSLRWCAPRGSNLARSARSNEVAASEVPAPVLGHPAVGGAVARYIADAWERQVIPEEQDTVGCRLIEQSPS